jgi:hypothetical protein
MSPIDPNQTAAGFLAALRQGASLRAQAVAHLHDQHQAQGTALKIEQSRVVSRYGRNSAQAQVIQARTLAHAARTRAFTAEWRRTQVSVPQPSDNAFIVYGLVLDEAGGPLTGITVAATADACTTLAHTKSNRQGAFVLCVPLGSTAKPGKPAGAEEDTKAVDTADAAGPKATPRTKRGDAKAEKGPSPQVQSFTLVLTDEAKTTTFRDPEVFAVKGRSLAYREIVMPTSTAV